MTARTSTKTWDTRALVEPGESASSPRTALIVLNSPLPPQPLFRKLWQTASLRFCADGGANRLYDRFVRGKDRADESDWDQAIDGNEELWLPDLILGDLDSLKEDVRKYYESKGVTVEQDPDEFSTDLGKNVTRLSAIETGDIPPPANSHARRPALHDQDGATRPQYHLVLIGGLSGRLDQTIHTLHAMTLLADKEKRERVWAIGKESAALLLTKGVHQLHIDLKWFGKTCGILPVGSAEAHVTTTGLEWDLGPTAYMFPTSLSAAVSTSNHLIQEEVRIETDVPVVWTMEVRGGSE
ncbi:hypothetical protein JCM10908_003929 [Rhodotorula pacifica]|uniref:thiamine diphosphokinase n=1 Tax=Rhodotorula pacifica TaxID=1495444 RepID=UPI003176E947